MDRVNNRVIRNKMALVNNGNFIISFFIFFIILSNAFWLLNAN